MMAICMLESLGASQYRKLGPSKVPPVKLNVPRRVSGTEFTLESPRSWSLVSAEIAAAKAALVQKRGADRALLSPGTLIWETQWEGVAHPEDVSLPTCRSFLEMLPQTQLCPFSPVQTTSSIESSGRPTPIVTVCTVSYRRW